MQRLAIIVLAAGFIAAGALVGGAIQIFAQRPPREVSDSLAATTDGTAAVAALPSGAMPVRAVWRGTHLVVLAQVPGQSKLTLEDFDPATSAFTTTALPLESGGLWSGLAVTADGNIWAASLGVLLRIASDGSQQAFSLPAPKIGLAPGFGGPSSPRGPLESGQVSSLAASGGKLYLGRAGDRELTQFDPATGQFIQIQLPAEMGDLAEVVAGPNGSLLLAVNHSAIAQGALNDRIGLFDPTSGRIDVTLVAARALASNGRTIAVGGSGVDLLDAKGARLRPTVSADYDTSRVTLLGDDSTAVRTAGGHAIAFIGRTGSELRRIAYQVPVLRTRSGSLAPYTARLAYLLTAPDGAIWFSVQGRPEVYRLA